MYLPLAERLIEKYVNENKVEAEAGKEKILRWMFADTILSYPSSLLSFPPLLLIFPSSPLLFFLFWFPFLFFPSSLLPSPASSPEVKLYLIVLEKLSKTEKRLEVIRGELGSSLCLITRRDDHSYNVLNHS